MKILLVLAAVALAIFVFRMLRSSPSAGNSAAKPKKVQATDSASSAVQGSRKFNAVSIKCGLGACEAALAMGSKRFLPAEMPQFPLADCMSANCRCKFEHHPERRDADGDKRAVTALRSQLYTASGKSERRTRAGRRNTDQE